MLPQKITSLDELESKGIYAFKEAPTMIQENHISTYLEQFKLTPADLSRMTGINKQNIANALSDAAPFNLEHFLKISHVLQVPVESLLSLNYTEWYTPYQINELVTYVDCLRFEIISSDMKKERLKDGMVYMDVLGKTYTEKEMRHIESQVLAFQPIKFAALNYMENVDVSLNEAKRIMKAEFEAELKKQYQPIYQKLYQKIKPKRPQNQA